jgi:hypothetical protein
MIIHINNFACIRMGESRRGGRVAEGPALEKRYPVNNGIVGSNPTLSASRYSLDKRRNVFLCRDEPECSGKIFLSLLLGR